MSNENDNRMIEGYKNMYGLLNKKKDVIIKLKDKFDEINTGDYSEKFNFIFDEINFMIETFEMCFIACENREGTKQSFFNLTTFNRASLSSTMIIYDKLKKIMVKNEYFSKEIKRSFSTIEKSIEQIIFFRNKVEHDIDPYYYGAYEEVEIKFNIEKQNYYIKKVLHLLKKLSNYEIKSKNIKFKINYEQISLLQRKEIISDIQIKFNEIFKYSIALSYKVEENLEVMKNCELVMLDEGKSRNEINECLDNLVTSDEEKMIIDLSLKTIELQKAMNYSYENKNDFKGNLLNKEIDRYKYFCHMCLIISYQIFDKIGLYLKEKLLLQCKNTYLKTVVDEIILRKLEQNELCNKICRLRENQKYCQLSKIRNYMVHENGIVEYDYYENELSSLIVANYKEIVSMVYKIISDYFNKNKITISNDVLFELETKTQIISLDYYSQKD